MPEDKWGIPFFYPTKKTAGLTGKGSGFFWQQNNNIFKDNNDGMVRLGKEHDKCKVINSATGEWEFPYLTDGDGLDLSGPTGHHSGGETHGCQGFAYMTDSDFTTNPPRFRFRKETYHVQYDDHPSGEYTSPFATGDVVNNWRGYGWVRYNKKDGVSEGNDSVICECWWNNDPVNHLKDGWKMLKRVEDKGAGKTNWGVKATCDGDDYQVGTWSNVQFRFKSSSSDFSLHPLIPEGEDDPNVHSIGGENMSFSDCASRGYGKRADMPRDIEMKCLVKWDAGGRGKAHFKNISLREIDPTLSFDDTPENPDPTETPEETVTIQGKFKLLWDLNDDRGQSQCAGAGGGGGGGGGTGKFYSVYTDSGTDQDRELSDSTAFQNRKRVVMAGANSSSVLVGAKPNQLDIPLKKVGTPATNDVSAKIWNSSGIVVYTSPTTFADSTLTTSYVKKTFDFSTNTHTLVTGDRIGVQYLGTSDVNYVVVSFNTTPTPNTSYYQYEGSTWEFQTRSVVMDIWQ
jgi:hypothetical protein